MLPMRIKGGWILDQERRFPGGTVQTQDSPFVRIEEGGEVQPTQGRKRTTGIAT
jgi:hypothetical protein